jgi:citrate synthase
MRAVIDAAGQQFGTQPSIELGLVVLSRALQLPNRTACGLFALGRSAGWVAHVLEQRLAGFLIRPRAKFV